MMARHAAATGEANPERLTTVSSVAQTACSFDLGGLPTICQ
jgi:hypothetical protein